MSEEFRKVGLMEGSGEYEEKGGGSHNNRLVYGLLMGAGINVDGLTPQQAWEMVSEMNLLASKEWKRSDEDKLEISNKNKAEILKGNSFDIIKKKAANFAKNIKL